MSGFLLVWSTWYPAVVLVYWGNWQYHQSVLKPPDSNAFHRARMSEEDSTVPFAYFFISPVKRWLTFKVFINYVEISTEHTRYKVSVISGCDDSSLKLQFRWVMLQYFSKFCKIPFCRSSFIKENITVFFNGWCSACVMLLPSHCCDGRT